MKPFHLWQMVHFCAYEWHLEEIKFLNVAKHKQVITIAFLGQHLQWSIYHGQDLPRPSSSPTDLPPFPGRFYIMSAQGPPPVFDPYLSCPILGCQ